MIDILHTAAYRKVFFGFIVLGFFSLLLIYSDSNITNYSLILATTESDGFNDKDFLVSSSKCKMTNLPPFNDDAKRFYKPNKYESCNKNRKLLTYTTVVDNIATLHINKEQIPSYTNFTVSCCYSNVTRKSSKTDPDLRIKLSDCAPFKSNVTLHESTVRVKCLELPSKKEVYQNAHVVITTTEEVEKKMDNYYDNNTKPISVIFVGIDSISRLNFIRSMPETFKFVEDNEWLPLKGYNKMDDNTFPNVMAIFTGMNQTRQYEVCSPKQVGRLDKCPILWYDYKNLGYITGYAEDEASINTFNYKKKGFTKSPTDYYFRPYVLASESLNISRRDDMKYCTGPETSGERILNIAKDFAIKFKDNLNFGFFWMNSFSHNKINSPSRMDGKVRDFLQDLSDGGVLNSSIVIFLSDHGIRFGDIRVTYTGWLEERLPFIYTSFPPWFQETFPVEYYNFKHNRHKLTSPYDLHMTLQHILSLSGFNRSIVPSEACPKCKSLFEVVEKERSCEDVGVTQHWCTCAGYKPVNLEKKVKNQLAKFVINKIQGILNTNESQHKCAKYSVGKVLSVSASEQLPYSKSNYTLIKFETFPKAIFETTIGYVGDIREEKYNVTGDISRLDLYAPHSYCIKDAYLKKYCYCW